MIFFVDNDGVIVKSGLSYVFQGSEDASSIYVMAPFAANAECTAVFKLPTGELKSPIVLTPVGCVKGVVNKTTGNQYALWKRSIPEPIARYYGEVQVQFYFHFADRILTTSMSTFTVGRGVSRELPSMPDSSVYEDILSVLSSIRSQLDNGAYKARSLYQWNVYMPVGDIPSRGKGITKSGHYCEFTKKTVGDVLSYSIEILEGSPVPTNDLYFIDIYTADAKTGERYDDIQESDIKAMSNPVYGTNEIVFYPDAGKYGAFVKSIKDNNCNNAPYIDGVLNSEWWAEIVNFNTVSDSFLKVLKEVTYLYIDDKVADIISLMEGYIDQAKALIKETECLENADTGDVVYELRTETDTTFTDKAISKLRLIVPEGAAHGFYAGVNFTVAETVTELKITNRTALPLKLMSRGAALESYDLTAKKAVSLIIYSDGINIYCNLVEV